MSRISGFLMIINMLLFFPATSVAGILFQENFDDANFVSRGWYDNTNLIIDTTQHISGSIASAKFHFAQGAIVPDSGGSIRKKFTPTDSVYVSFWVKHSSNWIGSGDAAHPHEFNILTNLDGDYIGPAYTHMTTYIEDIYVSGQGGYPFMKIQDSMNIDETKIGQNLVGITENRAIAGCNGDSDGYGNGSCYPVGTTHRNGKQWTTGNAYFLDSPGPYYKGDWHFIEAYFKLNSIVNGIGVTDGVMQYWYDGQLIIDHHNVMFRTGQNPTMQFDQFLIAPYMGVPSPVDQILWVDNLTVGTSRATDTTIPSSPTSLQVN